MKDGFVDFHVMFTNKAVHHQYLVYEHRGHFSKIVDINVQGGISIYRLPFWHYTTPLAAKRGREADARRWLLLGLSNSQIDPNITESGWMERKGRDVRAPSS